MTPAETVAYHKGWAALRPGAAVALRTRRIKLWSRGQVDCVSGDGTRALVVWDDGIAVVYPVDVLIPLEIKRCTCGVQHIVRDLVPFGLQDDGDGGLLVLTLCPACSTTLAVEARP